MKFIMNDVRMVVKLDKAIYKGSYLTQRKNAALTLEKGTCTVL